MRGSLKPVVTATNVVILRITKPNSQRRCDAERGYASVLKYQNSNKAVTVAEIMRRVKRIGIDDQNDKVADFVKAVDDQKPSKYR